MNKASPRPGALIFIATLILAAAATSSGIADLWNRWLLEPAYGHGFVIVLISLFLFASRAAELSAIAPIGKFLGVIGFALSALLLVASEFAQIHTLSQYLLIALIAALAISCWGLRSLRFVAPSLILLLFAIPLPYFLQTVITADLQLISSELGVWLLKLANVPVFLQGNVIDLGQYKLQVVEACAGLNYLYPLLGIAFICTCYLATPLWQRALILLSAVPITILLNSFRIAVTGLLVKSYGNDAADGFIHFFEGWLVFVACLLLLFLEIWLLARFVNRRPLLVDFNLDLQFPPAGAQKFLETRMSWHLGACVVMAILAVVATKSLTAREETIPMRPAFALFPMQLESWSGSRGQLDAASLTMLQLSDYLVANYESSDEPEPVELYIAYYDSQREGGSHSPQACLPGGGWEITSLETDEKTIGGVPVRLNEATVQRGLQSKLVLYWFQQGGKTFANEMLVKADLFRQSLLENSTNGALIRISTRIRANETVDQASERLQRFMDVATPQINAYIPH